MKRSLVSLSTSTKAFWQFAIEYNTKSKMEHVTSGLNREKPVASHESE